MPFLKILSAALLLGLAALQPCRAQSRIIGGSSVGSDRFPYFAELKIIHADNGMQLITKCGGALITSQVVLTAGHCFDIPRIISITVTLGRYSDTRDTTFQSIKAASWTAHPNHDSSLKTDDIGIVKLSRSVLITPIWLAFSSGFPAQGRNVTVLGYDSNNLNQVHFNVRNWNNCFTLFGEGGGESKICAGGNGKNACEGDSGGPMIVKGRTRFKDTLAGIVSHGPSPCDQLPIVYTRVSAYKNWIRQAACFGSNLPGWCSG